METIDNAANRPKLGGVDRNILKLTAAFFMLLDHVGIVLQNIPGQNLWFYFRVLGRMSFPLYCFLLVEGYFHTGNIKKYLLRLGIFALISEIPYDLLVNGSFFSMSSQNVFLTLILGLLLVWSYDKFMSRNQVIPAILCAVVFVAAGQLVRSDYGSEGVLLIFMFYYFRQHFMLRLFMCGVVMILMRGSEFFGIFCMFFVALYNGLKGWEPKSEQGRKLYQYAFYAFYPLHLLVLGLIAVFLHG